MDHVSCAFGDLRLNSGESARRKSALFSFEFCANGLARLHKLVEQVQTEGPEGNIGFFGQVDGSALRVKYAYARNEFILAGSGPFPGFRFGSDLVLYCNHRGEWCCAGDDITQDFLLPARPASALEDSDIACLARAIITINHGEAG